MLVAVPGYSWTNGQSDNATTNKVEECDSPPYSTHDWVADHALDFLPDNEKAWLLPHKTMYLLGTEAPDNSQIPITCGGPHAGYNDRSSGHSVEWKSDWSGFLEKKDRAAWRAGEEYFKAVRAYEEGNLSAAAFYLGAMAHYIGDVSQYGHVIPDEKNHSNYEGWVARRTKGPTGGPFEEYLKADGLTRRTAYTAAKRIAKITGKGKGPILSAKAMDGKYKNNRDEAFEKSVGHSLNLGVNELSDVLHTFYLNVVSTN
jgi:Zinc dependent phospholipase C